MELELAQQLKNAGYPQEDKGRDEYGFVLDDPTIPEEQWEHIYEPTLEELIKACGHVKLECFTDDGHCFANCCDRKDHEQIGKTPIEAVGKLWLALNKK